MFNQVILDDEKITDEAEYKGNVEAGSSIKFSRLLKWMNDVNAQANAKYLKCIIGSSKEVKVHNIVTVLFTENLVHKGADLGAGVKIGFKEDDEGQAMTVKHAKELFDAINAKCAETGTATDKVEVVAVDPNGKTSRFCWFYDDAQSVAVIVKNMNPSQAKKWLNANQATINKIAEDPSPFTQLEFDFDAAPAAAAAAPAADDDQLELGL